MGACHKNSASSADGRLWMDDYILLILNLLKNIIINNNGTLLTCDNENVNANHLLLWI